MVLVISSGTGPDGVSFSYNQPVDQDTARSDIKTLLDLSGWQATELDVSTGGEPVKFTSAEFQAIGPVNWKDGTFAVEPFILTFKRFGRVQIQYMLNQTFSFRTLRDYSDDRVDIAWIPGNSAYSYVVKMKKHDFVRLDLPLIVEPPAEQSNDTTVDEPENGKRNVGLALLIAILAGGVVFAVVSLLTRKRKE
jgi:hypothetical protein